MNFKLNVINLVSLGYNCFILNSKIQNLKHLKFVIDVCRTVEKYCPVGIGGKPT